MPIQNTNALLANNSSDDLNRYGFVRTSLFHYLTITDDEKQIFNSNGPVESKPNLVFYQENAETKVMLDYSGSSEKDKKYLDILFNGLNDFSGLSFSNASYLDEKNGVDKSYDLNLYFREYKNNILFAKTTTTVASTDLQKVFEGDYFIDVPIITSTSSWENKNIATNSLLISINPKSENNFSSRYIEPGDLIEIINPNSQNNNNKYEILEVSNINNKEIIKLKTKAISESLIGSSTIINFYAKTKIKNPTQDLFDNTVTGCCLNTNTNQYYNKTTQYECYLRANGSFNFTQNKTCTSSDIPVNNVYLNTVITSSNNANVVNVNNDLLYANAIFDVIIGLIESTTPSVSIFLSTATPQSGIPIQKIENKTITLKPQNVFVFRQTTSVPPGYNLRLSTTQDTFTSYTENTFGFTPIIGYNGYLGLSTLQETTLYLFVEPATTNSSQIFTGYTIKINNF
jgi:hypothetical protein